MGENFEVSGMQKGPFAIMVPALEPKFTALSLADPRWTRFVRTSRDAVAFHRPEWAQLLADCYGHRAFALARFDETGHVHDGLPILEITYPWVGRQWISLPFTDSCPLLAASDASRLALVDLLDAERRARDVSRLEIRAPIPGPNAQLRTVGVTHRLALASDPDVMFQRFKPAVQRAIAKGEREGVTIAVAQNPADLDDTFYRLHVATRARLGIPVQPRRYFRMLWGAMIDSGLGFVLIAFAGDLAIAAAVFLSWNGTIEYKYGASSPKFWALRPNNLLFAAAIRLGCEKGYHTFGFGRTDLNDTGLRTFKLGWGAVEEPLVYSRLGTPWADSPTSRLVARLRPLLRRSPSWVCRLIGEIAYKYAA
jgi:CelD/BcsL family acetyltransferase involved in cellulose biosynthesis